MKKKNNQIKILKKYKAKLGATFSDKEARIYGRHIEKENLRTPEELVSNAREKDSVLHEYFQWNNKKAADNFRLQQARHLWNHIETVYLIGEKQEQRSVRTFVYVKKTKEQEGIYMNTFKAMTEEEVRNNIIDQAFQELQQWQFRYATLKELSAIFGIIDRETLKFQKRKKRN